MDEWNPAASLVGTLFSSGAAASSFPNSSRSAVSARRRGLNAAARRASGVGTAEESAKAGEAGRLLVSSAA